MPYVSTPTQRTARTGYRHLEQKRQILIQENVSLTHGFLSPISALQISSNIRGIELKCQKHLASPAHSVTQPTHNISRNTKHPTLGQPHKLNQHKPPSKENSGEKHNVRAAINRKRRSVIEKIFLNLGPSVRPWGSLPTHS